MLLIVSLLFSSSLAFRSDELLADDEEFGLEGGVQVDPLSPDLTTTRSSPPPPKITTRKRYSDSDPDSKVQFSLEHAFGDSDFSPAGTFTARLKTWNHGSQVDFLGLPFLSFPLCSSEISVTWSEME